MGLDNYPPGVTGQEPQITGEWDDEPMYVVWNTWTGYSDESMRFATQDEALDYINEQDEDASHFAIREEG